MTVKPSNSGGRSAEGRSIRKPGELEPVLGDGDRAIERIPARLSPNSLRAVMMLAPFHPEACQPPSRARLTVGGRDVFADPRIVRRPGGLVLFPRRLLGIKHAWLRYSQVILLPCTRFALAVEKVAANRGLCQTYSTPTSAAIFLCTGT
jgi:hypothetical protein